MPIALPGQRRSPIRRYLRPWRRPLGWLQILKGIAMRMSIAEGLVASGASRLGLSWRTLCSAWQAVAEAPPAGSLAINVRCRTARSIGLADRNTGRHAPATVTVIHKSGSGTAPACRLREDTGMFGCRSRPPCSAPLGEPGSGPPDPGSTGRTERPSPLRAFRRSLPAGAASCLDGTRSSCLIVRIRWRAPLLELPRLKCLRSSAPG